MPPRTPPRAPGSSSAKLARYGFGDPVRAADTLGGLGLWDTAGQRPADDASAELLTGLAAAGDPDLAVHQLQRLVDVAPEVLDALRDEPELRPRLIGVLGASAALGDHLVAYPDQWPAVRRAESPREWRRDGRTGADAITWLRLAYRRVLLGIAAADLTGDHPVEQVMAELSGLADATLDTALRIAEAEAETRADRCRLAVIAMGKCGGVELNYVSDVDVVFVAEPGAGPGDAGPEDTGPGDAGLDDALALRGAEALARRMMEICRLVAWPVDAALRPEGKDGPLVRTLASHLAYYRRWARTWEFQALLKARPAAGDIALGERWLAEVSPLVWQAADRPGVVEDVRAMRRRVERQLPPRYADREIKLGPGGLRDIEFAVQLLQLVHGRADDTIRSPTTLDALKALTAGGYVGRVDGEQLADSYRFLRTVEHRLQLQRLRRTHRIPADDTAVRWLAQSLGYRANPRQDAVGGFRADWAAHASRVRRLHQKLLYRPVLEAVAKVPSDALRLGPVSARRRLEVLGFADPAGALRHIEALTSGVSRTAAIQRTLLPVMLDEFADAPEPDRGLLGYRSVSDTLGSTPWYLRLLRDEGPVALRMARLLALSRYATDLLARDPEALRLLAADAELTPRPAAALAEGMRAAVRRHEDPVAAVRALRALRRRELFRIAAGDLVGLIDVQAVGQALADVTDAVLGAALAAAGQAVDGAPVRIAVIGMGRLGGWEMSYPSDADVIFVHEPADGVDEATAAEAARVVAERLRSLLTAPAPDPPLGIDTGLRPEGRGGPLSRSLAAYRAYYRRWAGTWEAQALLRARFVCGDAELGERFTALADACRYPAGGLTDAQVIEIRRIKARVDSERLPRGADPATHTKLGRGGLTDVEWTVQLLQMRYAHRIPGLRTTRTLDALAAAREAGLVEEADEAALSAAWLLATRVRNAITLVRGRPSDQLPRHGTELAGVVRALGWPVGSESEAFVDEYLRTARRARQVVDHIFYE
ncbi:MAG: bifunctional [glutamine synthetase] adenylyltransferase/[glutamine synthetase]-adenylyl-L-tyrosine phosphorylase [Micromonosporaceae bacterium]